MLHTSGSHPHGVASSFALLSQACFAAIAAALATFARL